MLLAVRIGWEQLRKSVLSKRRWMRRLLLARRRWMLARRRLLFVRRRRKMAFTRNPSGRWVLENSDTLLNTGNAKGFRGFQELFRKKPRRLRLLKD